MASGSDHTDPDSRSYDRDRDDVEQQADADGTDLQPRSEYRGSSSSRGFVISNTQRNDSLSGFLPQRESSFTRGGTVEEDADIETVPASSKTAYENYYLEFAITQSALKTFDELVMEPDWDVHAKIDDEVDEDMTEALRMWGENCTIRAGEPGHDINNILEQCPSGRRAKPAVLIEKVGTTDDPDAIAALQFIEPWDMSARLRKNQNLVVQPGDNVGHNHPMVKRDGRQIPAAYVQYDSASARFSGDETNPIPFAEDDLIKLTYDPPDGSAWGRTIWSAIAEPIDALKQKLRDRNASIRLVGHPHRIYSSDTWTKKQAQDYADAHDTGKTSAWKTDDERDQDGYAGRIDYVPHEVKVQVIEGNVADISDAVMDDLEQIFSILPVSQHNIAYVEKINQFVVEPMDENDNRSIDKERRYLEGKFTSLFEDKADELADGEYEGEVEFRIRQPESDNPLERSEFEPERVADLTKAFTDFVKSGASTEFPRELPYFFAGMDRQSFEEEYLDVPFPEPEDESEDTDTDTDTDDGEGGGENENGDEDEDEDSGTDAENENEEEENEDEDENEEGDGSSESQAYSEQAIDESDPEVQDAAREMGITVNMSTETPEDEDDVDVEADAEHTNTNGDEDDEDQREAIQMPGDHTESDGIDDRDGGEHDPGADPAEDEEEPEPDPEPEQEPTQEASEAEVEDEDNDEGDTEDATDPEPEPDAESESEAGEDADAESA